MRTKLTLIAAIFIMAALQIKAQTIGLQVGATISSFKNSAPINKPGLGLMAGVFYEKRIKQSNFYLQPALNYQMLVGYGEVTYYNQINEEVLSYQKQQTLHQVQVPINLRWIFKEKEKYALSFTGGLNYAYLLQARQNPQPEGISHNITSDLKRHVLGAQVGLMYSYQMENNRLFNIAYEYQHNLTPINNNQSGYATHTIKLGLAFSSIKK